TQPCATVEHTGTPTPDVEDLSGPPEIPQCPRIESSSVVDPDVPVTVVAMRVLGAGTAQRDRLDARQRGELPGQPIHEGSVAHPVIVPPRSSSRIDRATMTVSDHGETDAGQ